VVAAAAGAEEPPAAPDSPDEATAARSGDGALAARVDQLGRAVAELQRKVDEQAAELTELRARPPAPATFRLGGLSVGLFGFVQADAVLYSQASVDEVDPATGAPLNETRFLIRRARLRVDADYGPVAASLELDGNTVNGPVARLIDAEASACWPRCAVEPLVMATLGLQRIPFGFEV
jgi:hypothetical protein